MASFSPAMAPSFTLIVWEAPLRRMPSSALALGPSNAILRACLEGGYQGTALMPIIDTRAAAA